MRTLEALYQTINNKLKGSKVPNEEVKLKLFIKLPDENRWIELEIIDTECIFLDISQEEQSKSAGMYPPTKRAEIHFKLSQRPDEAENVNKGSGSLPSSPRVTAATG